MKRLPTAVYSAPGKVLIAGGYIVLFPESTALSLALSSRIYASVYTDPSTAAPSTTAAQHRLTVRSPQFDSQWNFPNGGGTHPNPFVEACYTVVSTYFGHDLSGTIVLWSDSGFHSQEGAEVNHFEGPLSRFSYHARPITKVAKTGLGSSAALVVSLVAAMAKLGTGERDELTEQQLHNLSQIAHIVAQKKVGSGFDVATAVYGSIRYSRFPASEIPNEIAQETLKSAVDKRWPMLAEPCKLRPEVAILMGDVSQGSETPGMVRQVLQWREENPERASELFSKLQDSGLRIAAALQKNHGDIRTPLAHLRESLQTLTAESGVPIEPPRQGELLYAASKVKGVLGGVVPGAGGDDAVCLLVDTSETQIDTALTSLVHIPGVKWMQLNIESQGLRSESSAEFAWSQA